MLVHGTPRLFPKAAGRVSLAWETVPRSLGLDSWERERLQLVPLRGLGLKLAVCGGLLMAWSSCLALLPQSQASCMGRQSLSAEGEAN